MSETLQFELREFLYLDSHKVQSFASVINGGLATEVSERIKALGEMSGGIKAGIMNVGANLGASKSRESEYSQTLQITDTVLFDGVYRALNSTNKLMRISNPDLSARNRLNVREFIQIDGIASPPILENWLDQLKSMLNLLEKYNAVMAMGKPSPAPQSHARAKGKANTQVVIQSQQLKQFRTMVDLLEQYVSVAQEDPGRQYIRVAPETKQFNIWCGLLPEFILVPHADFGAEVTIVGQVERLVSQGVLWKLVDLSKFGDQNTAETLLAALNSIPMGLKPLTEEDLQAKYPDIFIRPIAIYR